MFKGVEANPLWPKLPEVDAKIAKFASQPGVDGLGIYLSFFCSGFRTRQNCVCAIRFPSRNPEIESPLPPGEGLTSATLRDPSQRMTGVCIFIMPLQFPSIQTFHPN